MGGEAREIDFGDKFGEVAVKVNGVRVAVHANGSIEVYGRNDVEVYTGGAVHTHPAINDDPKAKTAPEIGDEMEDGTILGGYYEGKPLYTTLRDEPLTATFKEAATQAGALNMTNALGHHDWRVPSKGELNVLWENRDKGKLAGTFNETGSDPAGWYWSSSQGYDDAWGQRFSDGLQDYGFKYVDSSLRCVR